MKAAYAEYRGGRAFDEKDADDASAFVAGWQAAMKATQTAAASRAAPEPAEILSWFPESDWDEESVEWRIERMARVEGAREAYKRGRVGDV